MLTFVHLKSSRLQSGEKWLNFLTCINSKHMWEAMVKRRMLDLSR